MLAAKFEAVMPHLDERQRRLLMGAEARVLGHGGIRAVARAAGTREATVSLGVDELESGAAPLGRVRRPGGGRKRLVDIDPGVRPALLALVEPDERGDPMSPLRWTTRSTRNLADELRRQGHRIGPDTVAAILRAEGFSLQANAKTVEGRQHPDRDGQFRYLNQQVKQHQAGGDPVISVDTKKKELVGDYAAGGTEWRPAGRPRRVNDHDFPDPALGKAIPYGIYDITADTGWVNVGTDHDTAAFAVESIRRWWRATGRTTYPHARRLLITADAGGSNGYRTRAWKSELADLAVETGLAITVCHFPPGTSKWNKIEHRLFSAITCNWRGRPLTSHQVIVNTIAATTTRTGLNVHAQLDTGTYDTGTRIGTRQMNALPLDRHHWHGDWNYTLRPRPFEHTTGETDLFTRPSPDLAWLHHPAITGLTTPQLDTLITTLASLHDQQHTHRRRRRLAEPGHRRALTLADRLLATILHQRLALPQRAIARLFATRHETINRHITQTRRLLQQAGHPIPPGPHHLATLDDLHALAVAEGITHPKIKPAS